MEICDACRNNDNIILRDDTDNDFKILKCNNCDAIFSNIKNIKINIDENIQLSESSNSRLWINKKMYETTSIWDYNYLKTHINLKNIKNVFEVGSQFGFLIKILSDIGIKSIGVEPIKIKGTVSDNIINKYFDLDYDETKKYDLICLTNMIHYFSDVYPILDKCLRMLNENGFLFITSYSVESSLISEFVKRREKGPLLYFSKRNYEDYCKKNNLKLLDYSTFYSRFFLNKISNKEKIKILTRFILYQFGLSKSFVKHPNGERNYILVQKSRLAKV